MEIQPPQGTGPTGIPGADKKLVAGLLGILLGGFGVHKFYLGYTNEGIIMLVISLVGSSLTCGVGYTLFAAIGIIEGILYLTKTDEEFVNTYLTNKKPWF